MKFQLSALAISLILVTNGCSQQNEVEQARKRVAELETELASLKAATSKQTTSSPSSRGSETQAKNISENPSSPSGGQWSYRASEEKMTGGTTYFASVDSTNTVTFRSPYNGSQNGRLVLRNDPKHGKDVMFSIEKGQILCRSYEVCEVLIRFDDGKPETFAGIGPADNSSETVFIRNYEKFLGKLRKSKMVRISLNIYQEGSPVFEFDTSGFSVEKFVAKR